MNKNATHTVEELLEVAERLRGMLDDEISRSNLLQQRNTELEVLLVQNRITIPDYELWHGELPMV